MTAVALRSCWKTMLVCGIVCHGLPAAATSQPPPDAPRPRVVGYVNAPFDWGGVTWIAYTWNDLPHLCLCIGSGVWVAAG